MYDNLTCTFLCYTFCTCWLLQRGKQSKHNEDDFDMMDMSDVQPRARSGRAASKPVKYHFDSDDDDDDDDM